jgi:hypothetical protein
VRVDGLPGQVRGVGDLLHARVRVLRQEPARRVEDRGDAAFCVGSAPTPAEARRVS